MGISAQQHRVCTGLFYRHLFSKSFRNVCPGVLSRHVFMVCLGIFYFYILTYMMFIIVDVGNGLEIPSHPKTCTFEPPNISSSMYLYVLYLLM